MQYQPKCPRFGIVPWIVLEERAPKLKLGERAEHEPAEHDHEGGEEARDGEVAVDLRRPLVVKVEPGPLRAHHDRPVGAGERHAVLAQLIVPEEGTAWPQLGRRLR